MPTPPTARASISGQVATRFPSESPQHHENTSPQSRMNAYFVVLWCFKNESERRGRVRRWQLRTEPENADSRKEHHNTTKQGNKPLPAPWRTPHEPHWKTHEQLTRANRSCTGSRTGITGPTPQFAFVCRFYPCNYPCKFVCISVHLRPFQRDFSPTRPKKETARKPKSASRLNWLRG